MLISPDDGAPTGKLATVDKVSLHSGNVNVGTPVLKIKYHGYHGRGTKGIWGDQRDVYCFFGEYLGDSFGPPTIFVLSPQIQFMVLPKSLFCPLKFSL